MPEAIDRALLERLREVLAGSPSTEVELRSLLEDGDAWRVALKRQLHSTEARLSELVADPGAEIAALAAELRRIRELSREHDAVCTELGELRLRARRLRVGWLSSAQRPI